jgi:hypothetical protein
MPGGLRILLAVDAAQRGRVCSQARFRDLFAAVQALASGLSEPVSADHRIKSAAHRIAVKKRLSCLGAISYVTHRRKPC